MNLAETNPLGYERIGKLILRFSAPAIVSNLLNAFHNIVDQILIGHGIGYAGIAAIGITFPLVTITAAISIMLGVGCASAFNLYQGAGKHEKAAMIVGNGLIMMVVSGLFITAMSLTFLDQLLFLFGATPDIIDLSAEYSRIIVFGKPFQILLVGAVFLIRSDGSPNWAMFTMMSGAVVKLIISPIFMFTFGWGVSGVAWATVISQVLSAGVGLIYIFRGFKTIRLTRDTIRLRFANIKEICMLGMAGFFNQFAMTIMNIVMNNTLRHYGGLSPYGISATLGAVSVATRVNMIFISCAVGLGQGCQPICGFNYGARNFARVKQTLKTAIICNIVIGAMFFTLYQIIPRQILGIFGEGSPEYFAFGTRFLRMFMLLTFVNGLQPLASSYFSSTGRAHMGVFTSMTRQIIFLIPLLLILPNFLGIDGVLYAGPIADLAAATLAIIFFTREFKKLNRRIKEYTLDEI